MSATRAVPARVDLRADGAEELLGTVLRRVEAALQVELDRGRQALKRRSVGAPTGRGTWVRVEARPVWKLFGQGNGVEASAALTGIAKPAWHASMAWDDPELQVQWRVDETALVTAAPIKPGGTLTVAPELDDRWWATLNMSLDALAASATTRLATLHTELMTQERLSSAISAVFGDQVDTTVPEWTPAHADLNWANLTAPECWILDWEDWGLAPRGLDSAHLWRVSLDVPALAERVARERHDDLTSRSGMLATLFFCCRVITNPVESDLVIDMARREAARLVTLLR